MGLYLIFGLIALAAGIAYLASSSSGSGNKYDLSRNEEVQAALAEERRLTRSARQKITIQNDDGELERDRQSDFTPNGRPLPKQDLPNYPRHTPR